MKYIKIILISIVMMFCLAGCMKTVQPDEYKINNETFGTIIDKFFVPHKDYEERIYINEKYETVERHYPDRWYLRIQREEEKDILQTDIMVSEEVWNSLEIGDYYGGE